MNKCYLKLVKDVLTRVKIINMKGISIFINMEISQYYDMKIKRNLSNI